MRLEDSDWQGKTEGEGYVHMEKPKYWSDQQPYGQGTQELISYLYRTDYLLKNKNLQNKDSGEPHTTLPQWSQHAIMPGSSPWACGGGN